MKLIYSRKGEIQVEVSLIIIICIPLISLFIFVCEELTQKGKKIFSVLSIVLLILMAIVGIILDINIYIGG